MFLYTYISESAFLTQFLSSCYSMKMADIPLVFVSHAVSRLPPQPLLGTEALAGVRSATTCYNWILCSMHIYEILSYSHTYIHQIFNNEI